MKTLRTLGTVTALLASLVGAASAQTGAKDLFYSPAPPPGASQGSGPPASNLGVSYWVELVDESGQPRRVTTDHVFRGGDRIRLHLVSNRDAYLTLINVGTTGRSHVLFPSPAQGGGDNFVRAFADYVAPSGYLRFDNNPGEETLILMLSPGPTGSLTHGGVPSALQQFGGKGAKDVILEVDSGSRQPATFAVVPSGVAAEGGAITLQIRLRHQ